MQLQRLLKQDTTIVIYVTDFNYNNGGQQPLKLAEIKSWSAPSH